MGDKKFNLDPEAMALTADFGIESTSDITGGGLDDFLNDTTASAKPEDISPIEKEVKPEPKKGQKTAEDIIAEKAEAEKAVKDAAEEFLSTGDESDEESETEGPVERKPKEEKEEGIFPKLAKDLFALGVFTPEENEKPITSPELFLEKFNREKEKQAYQYINEFLAQHGEDYREAFDAIFVDGVDPKEYFNSYQALTNLEGLDLKETKNQEKIFIEYWRAQGLKEEKIVDKLQKAKDYGDLESDSQDYHEVLLKREKEGMESLRLQKQAEEYQKKQSDLTYAQSLQGLLNQKVKDKEVDGIPISAKEAEEIFDYMYTKKWKLNNGNTLTDFEKDQIDLKNPKNLEMQIKAALLQKRKFDLSKIAKTAVSKESNKLFQSLVQEEKVAKHQFKATTGKSFF